jgi:hypothetical protein
MAPSLRSMTKHSMLKMILKTYNKQGALRANEVLLAQTKKSSKASKFKPQDLIDIGFVINHELSNSSSILPPATTCTHVDSLADAVSCCAQILRLKDHDFNKAQSLAALLIKYTQIHAHTQLPPSWIQQARTISENSLRSASQAKDPILDEEVDGPAAQWDQVLLSDPKAPTVVSDLLRDMIGLNQVKREFIRLYDRSRLVMDYDTKATSALPYNAILQGNPGTGKSTVAPLFGKLLKELGVVPERSLYVEATAASLISEGPTGLQDRLGELKRAGGGVFFIDDAHELLSDARGREMWGSILPLAARQDTTTQGRIVWVLAGPPDGMAALLAGGAGARGRFEVRLAFDDLTEDALVAMLMASLGRFARVGVATPGEGAALALAGAGTAPGHGPEVSVRFDDCFNRWTRKPELDGGSRPWMDEHGGRTRDPKFWLLDGVQTPDGRLWRQRADYYWLSDAGDMKLFRPLNGSGGWRREFIKAWTSDYGELTQDWPSRRHLRPFAPPSAGGVERERDAFFRTWARDAASGAWVDEFGGQALTSPLGGQGYELRTAGGRLWRQHTELLWVHRDGGCQRQRPSESESSGGSSWRQKQAKAWISDAGDTCLGWPSEEEARARGAPADGAGAEEGQRMRCGEADARAAIRAAAASADGGAVNARAVEALVGGALLRQADRIMRGRRGGVGGGVDALEVTREDLLGCA